MEEAELNSFDGDTIYVLPSPANYILDGQIFLKPGQKLIGEGPDVTQVPQNAAGARVTYSGPPFAGSISKSAVVRLSPDNEICNIHFVNQNFGAIIGLDDIGGTPSPFGYGDVKVNQCLFTGGILAIESPFQQFVLFVASDTGITNLDFTNNVVKDGEIISGLRVEADGNSVCTVNTENNTVNNIGLDAFLYLGFGDGTMEVNMLNDTLDDIGALGPLSSSANSDGVTVLVGNAAKIDILIDGYDYRNTSQVGGFSATAMEFLTLGPGFGDPPSQWADGAEITARLVNSSIRDTVTESIEVIQLGTNCLVDLEIDNTQILDANPREINVITGGAFQGGAISLLCSIFQPGNTTNLKIENSDIIGSTKYAVSALDGIAGAFGTVVIDMGNGALGSVGNNIIIGNALGDIELFFVNGVGQNNYWGGSREATVSTLTGSTFDDSNPLTSIPQRFYKKRCDKKKCHKRRKKRCHKRRCHKKHKKRCHKRRCHKRCEKC